MKPQCLLLFFPYSVDQLTHLLIDNFKARLEFCLLFGFRYQFRALFGGRKNASRTDSFNQKIFKHVYEVDSKLRLVSIRSWCINQLKSTQSRWSVYVMLSHEQHIIYPRLICAWPWNIFSLRWSVTPKISCQRFIAGKISQTEWRRTCKRPWRNTSRTNCQTRPD